MERLTRLTKFLSDNHVNCISSMDRGLVWATCEVCGESNYCELCCGFNPDIHKVEYLGNVCERCLCAYANNEETDLDELLPD